MSFNTRTEEYYKKFIELQEKLRKSEEERLKLEVKFNEMLRVTREEEQMHYRKLRSQYKRFLEEDSRRQDRNERILRTLERIENRVAMLVAKTERFKLLRQQYQTFLDRISRANQTKKTEASPKEKQSEIPQPAEQTNDIVQSYIQNLSSQKLKDLLKNEEDARKRLPFSVKTTPEDTVKNPDDYYMFGEGESRPIHANSIADDIMSSIYSRHNRINDDSRHLQPREPNNNFKSKYHAQINDFGIPPTVGGFEGIPPNDICRESITTQQTEESESDDSPESQISSKRSSVQLNSAFLSRTPQVLENPSYQNLHSKILEKEPEFSRYQEVSNDGKNPQQKTSKLQNIADTILQVQKQEPQKYHNEQFVDSKTDNNQTGRLLTTEKDVPKRSDSQNINRPLNQKTNLINDEPNAYVPQKHGKIAEPSSENVEHDPLQMVGEASTINNNIHQKTSISQQPIKDIKQTKLLEEMEVPFNIHEQKEVIIEQGSKICEPPLVQEIADKLTNVQEYKEDVEHPPRTEEYVTAEQPPQTSYDNEELPYSKEEQPTRDESAENIPAKEQKQQHDDEKHQPVESQEYHDDNTGLTYDDSSKFLQQHNEDNVPTVPSQEDQPPYEENSQIVQQYDEQGQPLPLQEYEGDQFHGYGEDGQLVEQFDENGQPLQVSEYDGQYLQQYDENGQPIQYDESGQFIQQYDENGQPLQQYDANGQPFQQYDENGQPFAQYDENGQFVGQYNENSQMFDQYDEHGQLIQQYDQNGQLIQQYNESGHLQQYQYDENGQIVQQYDPSGEQQYDEHGALLQPSESTQQFYEPPYEEKSGEDPSHQQYVAETLPEQQPTEEQPKDQNVPTDTTKPSNVMEMLDTDTESAKLDTKISNDSDFDFSNA